MAEGSPYEVVPVMIGENRIDFASLAKVPTGIRCVPLRFFQSFGFLWSLEIKENHFYTVGGKPHIQRISGSCGLGNVGILRDGKREEFQEVAIHIGSFVPAEIRDVLLYHELREAHWIYFQNRQQKEAHCLARYEEMRYLNKFATAEDKEIYRKFSKEIESAEWRPKEVSKEDIKAGKIKNISMI